MDSALAGIGMAPFADAVGFRPIMLAGVAAWAVVAAVILAYRVVGRGVQRSAEAFFTDPGADPLERLKDLGIQLPSPARPVASYLQTRLVPLSRNRALLYISGQIPVEPNRTHKGRVPDEVSIDEAREAARLCAINVLAQAHQAVGLDRVNQVVQLTGFVQCRDGFTDQPSVLNGASDLLQEVFGESGRHTRLAIGCSSLPLGVPVEIGCVLDVRT